MVLKNRDQFGLAAHSLFWDFKGCKYRYLPEGSQMECFRVFRFTVYFYVFGFSGLRFTISLLFSCLRLRCFASQNGLSSSTLRFAACVVYGGAV